jgi:ParB family transcriptional regulator, chromosome partitioning protein
MASSTEAMRAGRAESLVRRPTQGLTDAPGSQERMFEGRRKSPDACKITLGRIIADPNQPRTEFDTEALDRLASSLKARGQLQPVRVRWDDSAGHYVLVVGERRWRAARLAGLETLDCVVVAGDVSAEDLLEDQLVENALREDLKPVEQARSYRALMDARGMTHRDLAERLHVAHTTVTRALGLLNLPAIVQTQVDEQVIPASTAYEIASLEDPVEQAEVAAKVVTEGLTRKETAAVVRQKTDEKAARRAGELNAKGRGVSKAKPRPPTVRSIKTPLARVTVEFKKHVEPAEVLAALEDAAAKVRAELDQGQDQAAA